MARLFERVAALFAELRRRRVIRSAGLYLVAAWAVIEVTSTVFPLLFVPEWVVRAVTVVAVLGFPVAVAMAWAFDWTPAGLQRAPASDPPISRYRARMVLAVLTMITTGAVGATAWALWLSPTAVAGREQPLDPARVAVLYFDDHSEGGRLGYVAEGITEALIHELSQIEPLDVISRNGVKPYRNPTIPVDSIARALDVGSLVEGSVEGDRDRLVATVQLIDGRTGGHVLSRRLERRGSDVLDLRDAIVTEATRLLSQSLGRELAVAASRAETANAEAWSLVERARSLMDHADTLRWTLGDADGARRILSQADSMLARAEVEDPDWPRPALLRAAVARQRALNTLQVGTPEEVRLIRGAIDHTERVLADRPDHAEALGLRGILRIDLSWEPGDDDVDRLLDAAESDLRRAVELDPDNATAWIGLAEVLRIRGDFAEASVAADRALEADPFLIHAEQSILYTLAHVWLELEDFERAFRWNAEGRRRYPANPDFHAEHLAIMASAPGAELDVDSAWATVQAVEDGYGIDRWPFGELQVAAVLARTGREDSARSVTRRVRQESSPSPWLDYYEANVRLKLGEPARAIELLGSFLDAMPHRRPYIAREWWWRPLRDDPRFQALVSR